MVRQCVVLNLVLALLLVTGCGSQLAKKLNAETLAEIHAGMSQQEVRDILGTPTSVTTKADKDGDLDVLTWRAGGKAISVEFRNDKALGKVADGFFPVNE